MARKLTVEEQKSVLVLSKVLGKVLPPENRSMAGGITSHLVRLGAHRLSKADVLKILKNYNAGEKAFNALVEAGVLVPGADDEPGYLLHVPDTNEIQDVEEAVAAEPVGSADGGAGTAGHGHKAIARPETTHPLAKRGPRGLANLSYTRKQTPELTEIRAQIIGLDPRLWINGWLLSTPDAFTRYERELRGLDAALSGSRTIGDGSLSQRELCYQIFGDEKFLAFDTEGRKLLRLLGLDDFVRVKPQVKLPLTHHIPRHHAHMKLVISENLDPWLNMRELMYREGAKRILGERVHGIVFGDGSQAADPNRLPELVAALDADDVQIFYWGDIDRAGFQIFSQVVQLAHEQGTFTVEPFVPAYRAMLKAAMKRYPNPLSNEPCDQEGLATQSEALEMLEAELKPREAAYLHEVLDGSRLIPQEILTKKDL